MIQEALEIFLAGTPGLEPVLQAETVEKGFADPVIVPGGVNVRGDWSEVARANLVLRGASRVLVRIARFRALHLAQLDKRARKVAWGDLLTGAEPVKVEAVCRKSRIYHAKAAAQRIAGAIGAATGAGIDDDARIRVMLRIEDDLATISVDTSGALLHKRGHKTAVGKAPMRETLAALFLRQCGYAADTPVLDPMCGSGTFVIEAAEMALGLAAGRDRHFAFEKFPNFDADAWQRLRAAQTRTDTALHFFGSDRDDGAIRASQENAMRAGVSDVTTFQRAALSEIARPEGPPGLVITNPPYGARIGNRKALFGLYGSLGKVLIERFGGWRVGLITSDSGLARSTGLPLASVGPPIPHGGLKIQLFQTDPL